MATKNHEIIKIRNGIARQLREARISAHLSLAQIEKLSGIPADIIDRLEVGIKPVQVRSLKPSVVSAGNGVNLARLQLQVLMGMDTEVEIAADGNLKDYEM